MIGGGFVVGDNRFLVFSKFGKVPEQSFVSINVSDAAQQILIQQRALDRSFATAKESRKILK